MLVALEKQQQQTLSDLEQEQVRPLGPCGGPVAYTGVVA